MKFLKLIIIVLIIYSQNAFSQTLILNGSFESNNCDTITYSGVPNYVYDTLISSSISLKSSGFDSSWGGIDIVYDNENNQSILPSTVPDGLYFNCLASGNSFYEGISISLDKKIVKENTFRLEFDTWSIYDGIIKQDSFEIGLSTDSNIFGTLLFKILPDTNNWHHISKMFIAPISAKHLTLRTSDIFSGTSGTCIDNFILTPLDSLPDDTNSINEQLTQAIEVYPNPFKSQFSVNSKQSSVRNLHVFMYDIYGKQQNVALRQAQNDIQIDAQNLSSGVYFVELWGIKNGQEVIVGRKKIVKH